MVKSSVGNTTLMLGLVLATAHFVHAARIDIEAENPLECNVELRKDGPSNLFSGGYRLTLNSDSPIRVKYEFVAPEAGTYTLRVREYYPNGRSPLRWRVDDGEWHAVKQGWDLMQTQVENSMVYSEWAQVELKKGEHILEIETTGPVMRRRLVTQGDQWYSSAAVMEAMDHRMQTDVLIFTTEPLVPTAELARLYRETGAYKPYVSKSPKDWYELPMDIDTFAPSILDAIHPTAKPIPTDRSGVLRRVADHFEYRDGRRFHIWGITVPTAPPKQDAHYLARRLRRLGMTVARFHSLDGGLCDVNVGRNYVFDEAKFDNMNYFIARLREEGIYVMLDPLYNWQAPMLGEADGLPKGAMILGRIKSQFYIDPYLQRLNKDFLRKILTCRNPYTGMVNGKDPAIAFFSIVNENTLFLNQIDAMEGSEPWRTMLDERFNEWLLKRYGAREQLAAAWGQDLKPDEDPAKGTVRRTNVWHIRGPGQRASDNARFLYELQTGFYNSIKDFVTKELGFDHLLFNGSGWFGHGWLDTLDIAANLPGMDFYDQHGYGRVRSTILRPGNEQFIQRWPWYSLIEKFASRAPAGYPMIVTEWNNGNRPCGPMMMACYGALNGWDGLFQYHTKFWFDGWRGQGTPWVQAYMQYPIASLAFCRRDISESDRVAWRYVTTPDRLFDAARSENPHHTPICGTYPLIGKCEWVFNEDAAPFQVDAHRYERNNGEFIDSMTGELSYRRPIGQLQIRAPKLQGLVGAADGSSVDLGAVAMTLDDTGEISVCIAALDDLPLDQSKRMMLVVVGEVKPLRDRDTILENFDAANAPADWGDGEFLGKGGLAYRFINAKKDGIGAGPALALKPNGEGELAVTLPYGVQRLRFQFKPRKSGEVQLEVLVDGQVRLTTKKENIEAVETIQDPRLNNKVVPDIRDAIIEDMSRRRAQPGAEIVIRTTGQCAVPVGIDNIEIQPLPDHTLGDQLVMRPPVGDIVFKQPIKSARALDLSGRPKADVRIADGNTIRLDNTHHTPWFEITR